MSAISSRVYGCSRVSDDALRDAALDDVTPVEHHHAIGDRSYECEVVGDEDDRKSLLPAQVFEELDDRRLDRNVEGRGDLVADEHLRLARERASHRDALTLAA